VNVHAKLKTPSQFYYSRFKTHLLLLCTFFSLFLLSACEKERNNENQEDEGIILGFSQIGAESAWRNCNSRSIKEAAEEQDIQLLFENAEQKQENQIKALRSFIVYQVDVIVFVPIVTEGWDNILNEAKKAGIPVLITDRKIDTYNTNLYAGYLGTDSLQEGREAANFLLKKFEDYDPGNGPIKIVELTGTERSSPAIGRAKGFREILDMHEEFQIIDSLSGDFLRSKGNEIMRQLLQRYDDIDVVYSHNDGMTLGAVDAIKDKGLEPGKDIVLVSIDAEQAAIDALKRGEINCVIECNPKMGPAIMELAKKLARGESIPRQQHMDAQVFTEFDDLSDIPPRGY